MNTASSRHDVHPHRALALAALLILLAWGVLLGGAHSRYMRPDEHIAYDGTQNDLLSTVEFQARDVHAPLYFVSFWFWQQVFGDGEYQGRIFSILTSMLTVAVVFRLGWRWFGSLWAAALSALALALSSYWFLYALEIRPYAQVMLLAALATWAFARWLARPTPRRAAVYGLSLALMLHLHYFGLFLFLLHGLYFALTQWRRWPLWRQGVLLAAGAFVLWLPWFPVFIGQVRHVGGLIEDTRVSLGLGMAGTTLPTSADTVGKFLVLAGNGLPLLVLALIVAGGALRLRHSPDRRWFGLAAAWGLGIPLVAFLLNLVVPVYEPRYVVTLVPGLALLLGAALAALLERAPGLLRWPGLAAFALLGLLTVSSAVPYRVPLRDYLRAFEAAYRPGDAVYLYGVRLDGLTYYQFRHYAPSALGQLYVPEYAQGIENVAAIAPPDDQLPRRVWFVTSEWHTAETQARFVELSAARPQLRVIGDGAQQRYLLLLLSAPPQAEAQSFGPDLRFLGVDVERSAAGRGGAALDLKLWWQVVATPDRDYSFGLYLLDAGGALVAQADGPINNWGEAVRQTSTLETDTYYIDFRALPLPPGLPSGVYTLALAVYDPADGARLPLAGQSGDLLTIAALDL